MEIDELFVNFPFMEENTYIFGEIVDETTYFVTFTKEKRACMNTPVEII